MEPHPAPNPLTDDEVEQIANAAGLATMDRSYLEQLARSTEKGRFHTNQLPKDLSWHEELALTFRPGSAAGTAP